MTDDNAFGNDDAAHTGELAATSDLSSSAPSYAVTFTAPLLIEHTEAAPSQNGTQLTVMSASIPASAYLGMEWQINGTWGLHADRVWGDYTGAGVVVTDLDDGFQTNLPDFGSAYRADLSYDFITNTADGAAAGSSDNHGTAVMGEIIGSGANGAGSLGVAYGAEAFGMRMGFGDDGSLDQIQEGFQYAQNHGAAVMNNSWGFTEAFSDDFGAVSGVTYFSGIASAMQSYADAGRNGLGGVIVFAAGNDRADGDNTNDHNMQNSPYAITVAAIDSNGIVASFSTPGTSILVSAPGVNDVTTDRTGNAGYVSGDYIYFSGTSAAAPLVTGTVALMLQANPNLGWRDVQEILAYSTQHNDPASTGWQVNGATNWNGGGLYYSSDYGFGAVDAFTAVRLAETWNTQQDSANMLTVSGGSASPDLAINNTMAHSAITVAQNINVEHIEVNLNLSDSDLSHLIVTLVAPDGTHSVLVDDPTNGTNSNTIQFQTTTVADWGETSAGTWTLDVQDTNGNASGALMGWSLTFLGSAVSPNQTFIFTDEFAGFSGAALAARSVITDNGSGGSDTLNLAAVTTNSTVNLSLGTASIAGHTVTIAAGTVVNTVYGGDGNDFLTGNGNNDNLYGGRGNDTITVMGGTDHIDGGAGTDTVVYNEAIANFQFIFDSASEQTIIDTAGSLGTDTVFNVEEFSFAGALYTLQQLETYAANTGGNNGGTIPAVADDSIALVFPVGRSNDTVTSAVDGTQILTAANLGSRGAAGWIEIDRSSNNLTLDYLNKSAPHDVKINGGNGDETIAVSGVAISGLSNEITLSAGNDVVNIGEKETATIHAGSGNDTFNIGSASAVIVAGDGNNTVSGTGNNVITLGSGDNTLALGNGTTTVNTGLGDNTIQTGSGRATVTVGNGNNDITFGGIATIHAGAGANHIAGGNGAASITVGDGGNTVTLGNGTAVVVAGLGDNTIQTGSGHATITAGNGNNDITFGGVAIIHAGGGANAITGANGAASVTVGDGDNVITLGNGSNVVVAGFGDNTIENGIGRVTMTVGNGSNDITFAGIATIHAGGGANTITGSNGSAAITLGNGNNTVALGNGSDAVSAGSGNNTVHLGTGRDTVTLGDGDNTIYGAGIDSIKVGNGTNTITIAHGGDTIATGTGADDFIFTAINAASTIRNFSETKGDTLDISALLTNYDPLTQAIADFVHVTTSGKNTVISVDQDGASNGHHYTTLASIDGVHLDLTSLIASSHLVV